ncbi:GNAT family N-acetyltransferase [Microbacterium sp. NIBRBAC000506063]|uniref:GNAT family N-acetyltransferase n=1 Tax=Microbacterium sp. NIBRBAC000506063 TaxID=2734618 RepID=UPI001CB752F4|nr:GNAT family N-acetyltransferase [Microbacterium sp. NIBRBAC000506063]
MTFSVRRVRTDEWPRVRALRLEALQDADAAIAFLDNHASSAARPDDFWRERAENAASGDAAAQFIAEEGDDWIATVTVLRRAAGEADHHGLPLPHARADVVGVYMRPSHRGRGLIDALLTSAAEWSQEHGDHALTLDVHADNARARAAYARCGFVLTGRRFTSAIGDEVEMRRVLRHAGSDSGDRVHS